VCGWRLGCCIILLLSHHTTTTHNDHKHTHTNNDDSKRKGFIRLAIQAGADVIPVFAFGQSQTYKWLRPGPPLISQRLFERVARKIGTRMGVAASAGCLGQECGVSLIGWLPSTLVFRTHPPTHSPTHPPTHPTHPHPTKPNDSHHPHTPTDTHQPPPPHRTTNQPGMVPIVLLGRWGSPIPFPSALTVVIGSPLKLPHLEAPEDELVQRYLDQYILAMEGLFAQHKAAAGHKNLQLRVL